MSRWCGWVPVLFLLLLAPPPARALVQFAAQTGQPCSACHVGGFGPQLTPFGRAFKIGGYTQEGGEGWQAKMPLSAMLLGSFTNTQKSLAQGAQPQHFATNNNFALDQVSLFLAGRVNDNIGGLIQFTYSGVDRAFALDNTDIRLTAPLDVGGTELRVGMSINNNPTVQDPYNTTFAWGFPYVASAIALTPNAAPVLAGGLGGNAIGTTAYAWYDHSLYAEFGIYNTVSPRALKIMGTDYGPGGTAGPAFYGRAAYEWNWEGQSAHVGTMFLASRFNPTMGFRMASGGMGQDGYTDFAVDAGYQYLASENHAFTAQLIYTYEQQSLTGSMAAAGLQMPASYNLNNTRLNLTYYYQNTYGLTLGWQNTFGPVNPLLKTSATGPDAVTDGTGNRTGRPNSNAFIVEADWVPFGKANSWGSPWANLKLGIQYTAYTQFNGGSSNYDGARHNANNNNTLYLFAWLAF